MTRSHLVTSVFALATLVACADTTTQTSAVDTTSAKLAAAPAKPRGPKPKLGTFGVDTEGMDTSVKPGADFYKFAGGKWMADTKIPADKTKWGMFDALREDSNEAVHKILDEVSKQNNPKGSIAQKVGDWYGSVLDEEAIEKKGFAPTKPDLKLINSAKTFKDVVKLVARPGLPVSAPIGIGVTIDPKNPDKYMLSVGTSGLGLPDRDFYLSQDQRFTDIRAKYEAHITKMLGFTHDKRTAKTDKKDAADAKAIIAFETKIAAEHWERAKLRDRDKTYNPKTFAALETEIPKFPWKDYLAIAGFAGENDVIVRELDAVPKLVDLYASTPIPVLKAYMTFHYMRASASMLPKAIDQEVFDFYGKTIGGQPEQGARWKRAVGTTSGVLGEAVGQLYVAKYFQPRAKQQMDVLVENMRKAYGVRIEGNEWMTPVTKKAALEKLAAFRTKIAYPDKWRDYTAMDVQPGDLWGNAKRAGELYHALSLAKFHKPTDKEEWAMTPQTVNAYYNPTFNEIVFPAAILQAPFFDADADPAVNYGGIGAVIGHEMGHGFDDQGAKSDAHGVLRNWWGDADLASFKSRTDALAAQYSQYEPLPGVKVNGKLTLGENIGDLGGVNVALKAYQISLQGKPADVIDGFTGDQRFFLGYAQVWRGLYREAALRNQVMTDPHSPGMYRTNGIVRNVDAWYAAFDVKPTDPLFIAPEKRVKIW